MKRDSLMIVRGGGDLATGTIHRLWSAGLRVLVLETEHPAAIRRQVSLCEAVYEGETTVEGLRAVRISKQEEAEAVWAECGPCFDRPQRGEHPHFKTGRGSGCDSRQEKPWHYP